jgi:hypothetical protein
MHVLSFSSLSVSFTEVSLIYSAFVENIIQPFGVLKWYNKSKILDCHTWRGVIHGGVSYMEGKIEYYHESSIGLPVS